MRLALVAFLLVISRQLCAGQFEAGFAKVDITPAAGADSVQTITGGVQTVKNIYDPLYAKALVLSDGARTVAFVSLDLMYLTPSEFEQLLAALRSAGVSEQLFLSITHTHSGYVAVGKIQQLETALLGVVRQAANNKQPVQMGAVARYLDESYNRIVRLPDRSAEMLWRNPERKENQLVDQRVGIVHIKSMGGDPLVNMVNYSAHPVITMDLAHAQISADYPGQLALQLETAGAGETMFFLGAAGDINPYHADSKPIEVALKKSSDMAKKLAEVVIDGISDIPIFQSSGTFSFETRLYEEPLIRQGAFPVGTKSLRAEISTLLLTKNIGFASFPGEYFNDFGVALRRDSRIPHTFFLGYSNGTLGYVPTKEASGFGGYGADAHSSSFAASMGHRHVSEAAASLNKLLEK